MPFLWAGVRRMRGGWLVGLVGCGCAGGKEVTAMLSNIFEAFELDGEIRVRHMLRGEGVVLPDEGLG